MFNNLEFRPVESTVVEEAVVELKDTRNPIQKMFCNFNKTTGELEALPLHPESKSEYKHLHDCIPIMLEYRKDDESYSGPLKGKSVLVIGGRRKSRAGTGVEFMLDLEHAEEFAQLITQASQAARQYLEDLD